MDKVIAKNIEVAQGGQVRAKDVSFELAPGKLVALLGKNGSGKSSFLSGIFGMSGYIATGELRLGDTDLLGQSPDQKARLGLMYCPQSMPSIDGVTLIALLYGAYTRIYPDNKISILKLRSQIQDEAKKYNLKSELLDKSVGTGLSGGEKKQAEILSILALKPRFVFLDEIDSGVDINMTQTIDIFIKDILEQGVGVLLVSHDISFVEKLSPQTVIVLEDSKVVSLGGLEVLEKIKIAGL